MMKTKNGFFIRSQNWWNHAPEMKRRVQGEPLPNDKIRADNFYGLPESGMLCPENFETTKGFLFRHPDLQTPEEIAWLRSHHFSRWELMGASELADLEYLKAHPELLTEGELEAMREHLSIMGIS
jgi:hypothetical protein